MSTSKTRRVSRKVPLRLLCIVCGNYHSDIKSCPKIGGMLFSQCKNCIDKHGEVLEIWKQPNKQYYKGYFKKRPKKGVVLLGTASVRK